ncbi:MAG: T9SS type A sorting domain-containing protein [Saprospiraceae bacterium]
MKKICVLFILFIYFEINGQAVWTKTTLIDKFQIECLASINGDLYVGLGGGGVYKSSDEGTTWTEINNGIGKKYITSIISKGGKIYIASYGEGVFISENKGLSWIEMATAPGSKYIFSLIASGQNVLAATWDGIYYSSDEKKWTKAIISGNRKHNISLSFYESKKNLIAGSGQYVFTSKDNGKSWESVSASSLFDIVSFAEQGNALFIGTSGDGLYQSLDDGKNWIKKGNNKSESELQNVPAIIVDSLNIVAGSPNKGVINDGSKMNQGYSGLSIKSLIKHKGFYFAGTPTAGLWKFAVNSKLQEIETRGLFELTSAIYPNPWSVNSKLEYTINQKADVHIDLIHPGGKVIKQFHFLAQPRGAYEVELNDLDLSSGIYFLRIKVNDLIQLKKLFRVR